MQLVDLLCYCVSSVNATHSRKRLADLDLHFKVEFESLNATHSRKRVADLDPHFKAEFEPLGLRLKKHHRYLVYFIFMKKNVQSYEGNRIQYQGRSQRGGSRRFKLLQKLSADIYFEQNGVNRE